MSFDLQGKNAIVTGSTKGIGKAIANALAGAGANVVIVSRHQDDCDRVARELAEKYGVRSLAHAADLTRKADIDSLVEAAVEEFGRIDILVNNAGSAVTKKSEDLRTGESGWRYHQYRVCPRHDRGQARAALLRRQGRRPADDARPGT